MIEVLALTPSHNLLGGVEEILFELHRLLPPRGIHLTHGLARGATHNNPKRYVDQFDVDSINVDGRRGDRDGRRAAIRNAVRKHHPDAVLVARMADALPALAPDKANAPRLLVTVQSFEPEYLADLRDYAGGVDYCITSGELLRRLVLDFCGLPANRVVSIPGGVPPSPRRAPRRAGQPLRIGHAGRLDSEQKRVLDIPFILRSLADRDIPFSFLVAGDGPAREEFLQALAGLPVQDFHWVPRATLATDFYPLLDVFLHPAAWEGVSIAPREAMAHGVVPVVSRFPGWHLDAGFDDGATCLTFDVGNTDQAIDHVSHLARNPDLLERLSVGAASSQGGIQSSEGAADAWAAAFRAALDLPIRSEPIHVVEPPDGAMARLGVPELLRHWLRQLRPTCYPHRSGGDEWPHALRRSTPAERDAIQAMAASICAESEPPRKAACSPD